MKTVKQLLQGKAAGVCSIGPEAPVIDALRLMAEREIGALVVVNGEKLAGILSERDYARKVILKGRASKTTTVGELMASKIFFVRPDATVEQCMALMTDKHVRHLPVLSDRKLIGIISIGDLVKAIITDQAITIQSLQDYITGR